MPLSCTKYLTEYDTYRYCSSCVWLGSQQLMNSVVLAACAVWHTEGPFVYCWMRRLQAHGQFFLSTFEIQHNSHIPTPTVEVSAIREFLLIRFQGKHECTCTCSPSCISNSEHAILHHGYASWNSDRCSLIWGSSHFVLFSEKSC